MLIAAVLLLCDGSLSLSVCFAHSLLFALSFARADVFSFTQSLASFSLFSFSRVRSLLVIHYILDCGVFVLALAFFVRLPCSVRSVDCQSRCATLFFLCPSLCFALNILGASFCLRCLTSSLVAICLR